MAQNFDNHRHRPTPTFVATAGVLGAVVCVIMAWLGYNTMGSAVACLIIVGSVYVVTSRTYITVLQDRIIRMEMLYRADKLLSAAERATYDTLSIKQIVALRFASDGEFPGLVERASRENLAPRAIKQAITKWRPDLMRT
jgi:hypothetical protein